jgi:hypothetical protein
MANRRVARYNHPLPSADTSQLGGHAVQKWTLPGFSAAFFVVVSMAQADGPPSASPATEVDAAFFTQYSAMLESGFGGSRRLEEAERNYQAVHRMRPDDPRVEYGYALVLLKNFKQDVALAHLDAAIEADAAYLPAWRLRFGKSLHGRDFEKLFDQLLALSDVVGVISEHPPADAQRQEIATWLGRAAGYLEGPLGDYEVAGQAVQVSQLLRARLGEKLLPDFEAGRAAVSRQHQLLQGHQFAAVSVAETERDASLQESQTARGDLDKTREQVEMTKDQWDAWVKEQVGDIDSRLKALQKQYDQVREQQSDVNKALLQVQAEMTQLLTMVQPLTSSSTVYNQQFLLAANPTIIQRQLAARQAEMDQYLSEYNALDQERTQITSGAEDLFAQRDASLARYQQATGESVRRMQQIDRWDRRLEQEAEETERSDVHDARPVRDVRRRIQNWSTYEPFDLDREPDRLLTVYKVHLP